MLRKVAMVSTFLMLAVLAPLPNAQAQTAHHRRNYYLRHPSALGAAARRKTSRGLHRAHVSIRRHYHHAKARLHRH